jgi:hypothetical protein
MIEFLQGKKVYIVCGLTIIYALIGAGLKFIDWQVAIQMILTALGAAGFRSAYAKGA